MTLGLLAHLRPHRSHGTAETAFSGDGPTTTVQRGDSWNWDGETSTTNVKRVDSWNYDGEASWRGEDVDVDAILEEVKLPAEILSLVLAQEVEEPLSYGQLDREYHEEGRTQPSVLIW